MTVMENIWCGWDYTSAYGEFRFIRPGGDIVQSWVGLPDDWEGFWASGGLEQLNEEAGYDAYFGVLPRTQKTGTAEFAVKETEWLWCDIDAKSVPDPLAALNGLLAPAPSIIVHSGGGVHGYWHLADFVDYTDARDVMKAIATLTGGDSVQDAARVLRVPGSINHKYPDKPRARVLKQDERRVRFGDFLSLAPVDDRPRRTLASHPRDMLPTPEWLDELIRDGAPQGQRSEAAFRACLWLIRYGHDYDSIHDLFDSGAIGDKYRESGERWLQRTYEAALKEA